VADEICERLIDGETLVNICKNHQNGEARVRGTFPNHATVYDWADPSSGTAFRPEFAPRFARARLAQHRSWIETTIDIARTPQPGIEEVVEHSEKFGTTIRKARKDMLQHRALQIDTAYRAAARLDPARWAERLQQAAPRDDDPAKQPDRLIIMGGLPEDTDEPPPTGPDTGPPPNEE
jgi:hypothetical protein